MPTHSLVVSLLLCVATTSCARPAPDGTVPGGSATVRLERRPCFGTCPVYSVALYDDGTVLFDGALNVRSTGRQVSRIAKRDVSRLVARLNAAGFAGLPDKIVAGSPACGDYATDAPTVIVTLRRGSVNKTVEHDRGCAAAPAFLRSLEQAIDSVARTDRWIAP